MWDRREALHQSRLADASSAFSPQMQQALAHLQAQHFDLSQSYGVLARSLSLQAYQIAADDLFWISGWLMLGATALIWMARRSVSTGGPAAAD